MISILILLATSLEAINSIEIYRPSYAFCGKLALTNGSCIDQSMLCKAYKPNQEKTGNDSQIVHMNKRLRSLILDQHNIIRDSFACGNASNIRKQTIPEAAKMGLLGWNDELSWSAGQLAKTCINSKVCPASDNFLKAGQNIYMYKTHDTVDFGQMINNTISKWISSTWYLELRDLDSFQERITDVDLYQIAQIINDKATLVGCALYYCGMERDIHNYFFVCNYDVAIFENDTIYTAGKSRCLKHGEYKCLCGKPVSTGKSHASRRFVRDALLFLCILGVSVR